MTTDPKSLAKALFDFIEAHQLRREPIVLAHVEAIVEQHAKPTKEFDGFNPQFIDHMKSQIESTNELVRLRENEIAAKYGIDPAIMRGETAMVEPDKPTKIDGPPLDIMLGDFEGRIYRRERGPDGAWGPMIFVDQEWKEKEPIGSILTFKPNYGVWELLLSGLHRGQHRRIA